MKRYARGEPSSAFSLFPFLAVLLCTMGALAVLLVAMAQVSKDKAKRQAQAAVKLPTEEELAEEQFLKQELAKAEQIELQVTQEQEKLTEKLSVKQKQLRDAEDHIRRLQDDVKALQAEAMEIIKLDELHVSDHSLAEQEIERLQALKQKLTDENQELAEKASVSSRRYAIVPLRQGDSGTRRPAIYFECVSDGVILQPEGIKLTQEDFAKPIHVSSPLAAAVRAIQQYYVDYPLARASDEEGAPYPLFVIRPGGVRAYYSASTVLKSIDADYGYQPVAADWDIEYELPNPVMAKSVARAIELARLDRQRLAASAPQLFQHVAGTWGDEAEVDLFAKVSHGVSGATAENPFSGAAFGGLENGYLPQGDLNSNRQTNAVLSKQEAKGISNEAYQQLASSRDNFIDSSDVNDRLKKAGIGQSTAEAENNNFDSPPENSSSLEAYQNEIAKDATTDPNATSSGAPTNSSATNMAADEASGPSSAEFSGSPSLSDKQASASKMASSNQQGNSGSGGRNRQETKKSGIGILRLVPLQVSQGSVAIVEARSSAQGQQFLPISESIPMSGAPNVWMPELLDSLQKHAASWGIAGEGMYWKSKIVLHVDDMSGEQAKQLAKYLRQSGIEIHRIDVANGDGGNDAKIR